MPSDLASAVRASKALLFDLFHTLTPPESIYAGGGPMTHGILGVSQEDWHTQLMERSRDRLAGEIRDPYQIMRSLAHAIDPTIPEETIVRATDSRIERFATSLTSIPPENTQALRTLRTAGKKLALISNADAMEVAAWNRSPLASLFDATLLSCEVGCVKPEPEIFELALRQLDLLPRECIFVGDGGSHELEAARACGMTTVMMTGVIREIWPELIEPRRPHADFVIERIPELCTDERADRNA